MIFKDCCVSVGFPSPDAEGQTSSSPFRKALPLYEYTLWLWREFVSAHLIAFNPIPVIILLQGSRLPSCGGCLEDQLWPVEASRGVLGGFQQERGHGFGSAVGSGCPFEQA